ncbi:MAG: bacterio-opsin activator domain-containing protein [Halobacteria archaeon]|nr:bacterio-opsin activator domain-containing protein [Halobacteria archaeon]
MTDILRESSDEILERRTREGIEEAVCETLTSTATYTRAWVSEVKNRNEVVLREYGVEGETDPRGCLSDTEKEAVLESAERRERRVVESRGTADTDTDTDTDTDDTDTGTDAETEYIATVPISFEDVPYGILGVVSERRFSDDEVHTFESLSDLVGFTISSAETRKSLLSDRYVELEFGVSDSRLFSVYVSEELSSTVEIESMVQRPDGRFLQILTVEVDGTADSEIRGIAERFGKIDEYARIAVPDDTATEGRCRWAVITSKPCIAAVIAEHGGKLETAAADDGEGTVVARLPPESDVSGLMESLESEYDGVEILARRDPARRPRGRGIGDEDTDGDSRVASSPTDGLTRRQTEVLETAYLSGYFEYPRSKTSDEVADMLGISQPTFSEHIREAESEILSSILGG